MTQHVLLNSVDHQHLRVITERGSQYGDNLWFSPTFPLEFRSVQAQYPIFLSKMGSVADCYQWPCLASSSKRICFCNITHMVSWSQ